MRPSVPQVAWVIKCAHTLNKATIVHSQARQRNLDGTDENLGMPNVLQAESEQVCNVIVQAIKDLAALFARLVS